MVNHLEFYLLRISEVRRKKEFKTVTFIFGFTLSRISYKKIFLFKEFKL